MLTLMVPRTLGLAVSQLLFVILGVMATTLSTGSMTIFQFAYNIQFFPVGIIGVSFAIAAFPALSEKAEQQEHAAFLDILLSTIRQMVYLLAPMTVLFLVLRAQAVRVVVGAGEFDWPATIAAADTLAFFVLTLIPQALVYLFARSYFAMRDTTTPLATGVVSALVGILVAFLLRQDLGVMSLAIGYSSAAFIQAALLWFLLRQRLGSFKESSLLPFIYKVSVATLLCAVVTQLVKPFALTVVSLETFWGVLTQALLAGGAGLFAYLLMGAFLHIEEQQHLMTAMKRNVLRRVVPSEAAASNPS
jgi:putative peptidoglycan lipid II flippase